MSVKSHFVVKVSNRRWAVDLLPSQHNSLPFAESAIHALVNGTGRPDEKYRQLFVECPGDKDFAEKVAPLIASHMPGCGVVIAPSDKVITTLAGPVLDSGGAHFAGEGEQVYSCSSVPVSPTDSICVGLWCAEYLLPGEKMEIVCGDAPTSYREQSHPDRGNAVLSGAWNPWQHSAGRVSLHDYWAKVDFPELCEYDKTRDSHMSRVLLNYQKDGPTLAIIGAAHLDGVARHFRENTGVEAKGREGQIVRFSPPEFIPLAPGLMHELRWLEFPYVAEKFVEFALEKVRNPEFVDRGFDISGVLDTLIREAVHASGRDINPRTLTVFQKFLSHRLTVDGRWIPPTIRDLVEFGEFCVSRHFGEMLGRVANRSSVIDRVDPDQSRALVVQELGGILVRHSDGKLYLVNLQKPAGSAPGIPVSEQHQGKVGLSIAQRIGKSFGGGIPATSEFHFRTEMNKLVRIAAHRKLAEDCAKRSREWESRPLKGDVGLGIDMRGTIKERATGHTHALRVKQRKNQASETPPPCNNLCPVVYVFDAQVTWKDISYRQTGDYWLTKYRSPAAAYFYTGVARAPHSGIKVRQMAVYANLYWAEADVYDKEQSREWLEVNIAQENICKIKPWDSSLEEFAADPVSMAVAWAIRFSTHHCTVVAESHIEFPWEVISFASERNVEIVQVLPQVIGEDQFDRLRWDSEISEVQGPGDWTEKFIRPIPEV
ncbi:MAG: hypothetical protein P1V20_19715 [Verrucomicrobiales bacterium]|nr:hypothetical protein [Verrucomicrobiales bacterium]